MNQDTHVDFSEVVADHFAKTGELHAGVSGLAPDRVKELIDAVPDETQLIEALKELLRREGVCPVTH